MLKPHRGIEIDIEELQESYPKAQESFPLYDMKSKTRTLLLMYADAIDKNIEEGDTKIATEEAEKGAKKILLLDSTDSGVIAVAFMFAMIIEKLCEEGEHDVALKTAKSGAKTILKVTKSEMAQNAILNLFKLVSDDLVASGETDLAEEARETAIKILQNSAIMTSETAQKICSNCGAKLPAIARFCGVCGVKLET